MNILIVIEVVGEGREDLLQRVDSCDYGGWEVPRCVVGKLETSFFGFFSSLKNIQTITNDIVPIQKLAGLRPRKADVSVWVWRQEDRCSGQAVRQEDFPFTLRSVSFFVLFRYSTDWIKSTHIKGGQFTSLKHLTGDGNGNPLQYSCLENTVDGGAWRAAVHGVTKSRTQLSG